VAGVIGDPVDRSLSPVLHNAAFRALGLDWIYVAFPVASGRGAEAVAAMRTLGLSGLSVTMPHKSTVGAALDRLGPVARRIGAVNTISWAGSDHNGPLVGDSTDGPGFLAALVEDEGFDPMGARCVVLGAGGAGRAVTAALADAGAESVDVIARSAAARATCAALAGERGRAVPPDDVEDLSAAVSGCRLLVNATPVGMAGNGIAYGMAVDLLGPGHHVVDLVYAPAVTPLMAGARERGATASNGLGMLIRQAGMQVEIWTGRPPPLDVMSAAAVAALAHSH
jgi:shikimate dehydrogenase